MKRFLFITLLFFFLQWSPAQRVHVTGYVSDARSGEKLLGAQVCEVYTKQCVITNDYGYFHLNLPWRDSLSIKVVYLGYKDWEKQFRVSRPQTELNIQMEAGEQLGEVVLKVKGEDARPERQTEMSHISLHPATIQTIPVILAEPDLIKAMQKMPGVQAGSELFGGMYVRGGGNDQNLYLMDDVPLYYINHLGGFLSVFNTYAIKRADLYKGDFPARYGGRLSSVLDVRMRDGNKEENHGEFSIGLLTWKYSREGPLVKGKSSYFVSARRFMYDLITRFVGMMVDKTPAGYTFYDFNVKLNHELDDRNKFFLSWYFGDDAFSMASLYEDEKESFRTGWGNHMFSLRWNHHRSNGLFANNTLYYTRYRLMSKYKYKDSEGKEEFTFYSGVRDLGLKSDWSWNTSHNGRFDFGGGVIWHHFTPGRSRFSGTLEDESITFSDFRLNSGEFYAYGQWKKPLTERLSVRAGLRLSDYLTKEKQFFSWEPRLSVNFRLSDYWALKSAYSEMQQPVHLLISSGLDLPVSLWMPSTSKVPPGRARIVTLGIAGSKKDNTWDFSVETYYKQSTGLIHYKHHVGYLNLSFTNWEDLVYKDGKGQAYGIEFLARKKKGKVNGWLAYSYSKSYWQFDSINGGKPFHYYYNREHNVDVVLNYNLKRGITFSAAWNFGSGLPVTLPLGRYLLPVGEVDMMNGMTIAYEYTGMNEFYMHPYHRLDVSAVFAKKKKRGERIWTISIYNVYNRQNPFMYFESQYNPNTGEEDPGIYQVSLFPIIPSISYTFKF